VEHRTGVQADVAGGLVDLVRRQAPGDVQQHVQAGEERAVGEDHGLRLPGGARGEDDDRRLVLLAGAGRGIHIPTVRGREVDLPRPARAVRRQFARATAVSERQHGLDQRDRVGDLELAPPSVRQHGYGADLE
jgi:hypothetical protein